MKKIKFSPHVWDVSRTRMRQLLQKQKEKTIIDNIDNSLTTEHNTIKNPLPFEYEEFHPKADESIIAVDAESIQLHTTLDELINLDEYDNGALHCEEEMSGSQSDDEELCEDHFLAFDIDIEFCEVLKNIFIEHQITVRAIADILKALRNKGLKVPKSKNGLFRVIVDDKCIRKTIEDGDYIYIGIENNLLRCKTAALNIIDKVWLDISIDGFKPFKNSSRRTIWPISGAIRSLPDIPPFVIAAYSGTGHPPSHELFFTDFVTECQKLENEGILVSPQRIRKTFGIRLFCCDAPAKSFLTCTRSHTSKNGCTKCDQVGYSLENRIVYSVTPGKLRTFDDFRNRTDVEHHSEKYRMKLSVLEKGGWDLIALGAIDPMHLVDLGHAKKLLALLVKKYKHKFEEMDMKIKEYANNFPEEFSRKPRSLKDLPKFKATECHMFVCYYGPILLKNVISRDEYENFLLLFSAIRLLSHSDTAVINAEYANLLLQTYVIKFAQIYGNKFVNYNVHNLLHLASCVLEFGDLNKFSAYIFENSYNKLGKGIRSPSNILAQVYNTQINFWTLSNSKIKLQPPRDDYKHFSNACRLLKEKTRVRIINSFENENGELFIRAHRFLNCRCLFETPFNSEDILQIVITDGLDENNLEIFPFESECTKLIILPYDNTWALIPFLHQI